MRGRCWALRGAVSRLSTLASGQAVVNVGAARTELERFVATAPPPRVRWLLAELASDHAGETGAVYIYRGAQAALGVRGDDTARAFVRQHLATEAQHLEYFDALLAQQHRSSLLPAWRAAGFALGWLPTAVGGSKWLYATVEAVETFVEEHYAQQTADADLRMQCPELVALMERCAEEEVEHKRDAASRAGGIGGTAVGKAWSALVGGGSAAAVALARRL